jgi:hypothetical protein
VSRLSDGYAGRQVTRSLANFNALYHLQLRSHKLDLLILYLQFVQIKPLVAAFDAFVSPIPQVMATRSPRLECISLAVYQWETHTHSKVE